MAAMKGSGTSFFGAFGLSVLASGCLGDWGFDEPFPCQRPEDCASGYVCHETEAICVPEERMPP